MRKLGTGPAQDALGIQIFGNQPSRMSKRSAFTTILGPTFGLMENMNQFASSLARTPVDGVDPVLNKGAKLLPFGNMLPALVGLSALDETTH
jgi:hypothetical protein